MTALTVHTQERTGWIPVQFIESGLCSANSSLKKPGDLERFTLGNPICEARSQG